MDRKSMVLVFLATAHTALLVTSTVAGSKMVALPFGYTASATVLSYALTFVVLDTIAELYGRETSRFVINVGLLSMLLSAAYFQLAILSPPAEHWPHQDAFRSVLESSWRIWLGGWIAYTASQYIDVWSFLALRTGGAVQAVPLRAFISTALSQAVDTVIFITIAFYGLFPVAPIMIGQFAIKLFIAIIAAPLVAGSIQLAKNYIETPA